MKVIVVDDEPAMHLILSKMLGKLPGIQVAGTFSDAQSAHSFLNDNTDIGLAFVDISMNGENGMEFTSKLERAGSQVQIIFVTSHKDFALEAYELSVLDYLVKPVSQDRLQRAVNRALMIWRASHTTSIPSQPSSTPLGQTVITMLGDVVVSNAAGRVKWISRKCAELFAYLILHRGRRIPRSRLLTDIFGGMDLEGAVNYLNTTVYQLRKSLEPLGLREAIRSENDGYAIELLDPAIDSITFERQLVKLSAINADNIEDAMKIEQLYTGDLFGDKAYVWAAHEVERIVRLYIGFAVKLAAALIAIREMSTASKLLLKLIDRYPFEESIVLHLMLIRVQTKDKKGLTALYMNYAQLLERELGIGPSEEMEELYRISMNRLSNKKTDQ